MKRATRAAVNVALRPRVTSPPLVTYLFCSVGIEAQNASLRRIPRLLSTLCESALWLINVWPGRGWEKCNRIAQNKQNEYLVLKEPYEIDALNPILWRWNWGWKNWRSLSQETRRACQGWDLDFSLSLCRAYASAPLPPAHLVSSFVNKGAESPHLWAGGSALCNWRWQCQPCLPHRARGSVEACVR